MKKLILIAIATSILSGCGDSGNDSTPPEETQQIFELTQLNSKEVGTVYTTPIIGNYSRDTDITYTDGSYTLVNRSPEMIGGVQVIPQDVQVWLQSDEGINYFGGNTTYRDMDGYYVGTEDCPVISSNRMPETVTIGESGTLFTDTCGLEVTWVAKDDGYDNVDFVVTRNDNGVTEYSKYTISPEGDIISFDHSSETLIYHSVD